VYELIILSLVARGPVHGYIISSVINDVIGPYARASNGRIYPLLAKLEESGFIAVDKENESDGGRVSRSFAITALGRKRFHDLMMETTTSPREYRDLFAFKVTAFDLITKEDRTSLLQHYVTFADAHVRHLELQGKDLESADSYGHSRVQRERFGNVFAHLVATWKREKTWATELLAAEPGRAKR
jgi:DNA-binding PadR family transcriptional regulator